MYLLTVCAEGDGRGLASSDVSGMTAHRCKAHIYESLNLRTFITLYPFLQ